MGFFPSLAGIFGGVGAQEFNHDLRSFLGPFASPEYFVQKFEELLHLFIGQWASFNDHDGFLDNIVDYGLDQIQKG